MNETKPSLMLKRPVSVKAIVTPRWKQEVIQQLQGQISQLDAQAQQLESQGVSAIEEIKKQNISPVPPQAAQQIDNIQSQVNQKKSELLQKKNQLLQQLQQIQTLELGQEVVQAQMESFFQIEEGQNLIEKLKVEIVLRDGIVEEIRGEI